jgi:hypothetical protein
MGGMSDRAPGLSRNQPVVAAWGMGLDSTALSVENR